MRQRLAYTASVLLLTCCCCIFLIIGVVGRLGVKGRQARHPRPVILLSASNRVDLRPEELRVERPIIFTPQAQALRASLSGGSEARAMQRPPSLGSVIGAAMRGARERGPRVEIVECRADEADGQRCDLGDCLSQLYKMGYRRLMVEGTGPEGREGDETGIHG